MTATADRPAGPGIAPLPSPRSGAGAPPAPVPPEPLPGSVRPPGPLRVASGVELLGDVAGSGYKRGSALVRRADGQMVQLGPLMYGLLAGADGDRDLRQLADRLSERVGRRVGEEHVACLAEKLARAGLLAGTESLAPPRRNPLLALRWKVLVTNPHLTQKLTAPFTFLFRPWIMWPVVAAFGAVFWFVMIRKGVASATSQAFHDPGLLLLVFALTVASAGFHEIGHAAACRYAGATPGGMGMALYLVWPAFYTDVTDVYRLPRRDRLRVDLAGLYFNAVVAVITMVVWLVWRADALLLLVALQLLQMVKQLSPIIRADGYHILSDATGVPDLYAHMGPTLRRLLPGHLGEPSALTGRSRLLVTAWVLVMVPVMVSLLLGAVLLLPHLAATAWADGRGIAAGLPSRAGRGDALGVAAAVLGLVALAVPVAGSALVTQKVARSTTSKALAWSRGRPARRLTVVLAAAGAAAGLAWAWWPAGQYQPVRAHDPGNLPALGRMLTDPGREVRPGAASIGGLAAGRHVAVAMIPVGGATRAHPALLIVTRGPHRPPVALVSDTSPFPGADPSGPFQLSATAFPFTLPPPPGVGGTQAVAVGTSDGGVVYQVAYGVVTVPAGAPVGESSQAFALASCRGCTTVAVSFQVVLVVGSSGPVAPVDAAVAANRECPACVTTAIADQMVVTLAAQPTPQLIDQLQAALQRLDALRLLGPGGTPAAVAGQVTQVEQQVQADLQRSGLLQSVPGSTATGSTATDQTSTTAPSLHSTSTTAPTTTTPTTSTSGWAYPYAGSTGTTTAPSTTTSTTTTSSTATTASSTTTGSSTTATYTGP